MTIRRLTYCLILVGLLLAGSAQSVMITGAFTGLWYDESAPGQGFLIQVVDVEGEDTVVAYWFTFDPDGNQLWLVGQGAVDGDSATMTLFHVQGGVLTMGGFDPSQIMLNEWGELTIQFDDCNAGTVSYSSNDAGIGDGQLELQRLTESLGDDCSGGISDNVPSGSGAVNLKMNMESTGLDANARGDIKYEQNANFTKLKVHVHRLDQGDYELLADGESVGTLSTNPGGNGKLFFRSPEACNWVLLDFDPLDKTFEVVRDGEVYLSVFLDGSSLADGEGDDGEDEGDDDPDDSVESCDDD